MNDNQISLVKESWAKVAPIAPTAATLFYDRLFSVAPAVRPLFADDMTEQKRKLIEMLTLVVDGLDNIDAVVPEIEALGRRHRGYGTKPEHYDVVGECLLWTLSQGLGEDFTPEVKTAWTSAYGVLAATMIKAQTSAQADATNAAA